MIIINYLIVRIGPYTIELTAVFTISYLFSISVVVFCYHFSFFLRFGFNFVLSKITIVIIDSPLFSHNAV